MVFFRLATISIVGGCLMTGLAKADCTAQFSRPWGKAIVSADSLGPDCPHAVLVLTIRDGKGNALWVSAYRTSDLMTFQDLRKTSAKDMAGRLREWVTADKRLASSASLPDWPSTTGDGTLPSGAEFPFRVAEGVGRDDYLAMQTKKFPLLCLVTGMESESCLVLDGSAVTDIGTQSFPG